MINYLRHIKSPMIPLLALVFQAFFVVSIVPKACGWIFWSYKTDGTVVSVGVSADGNYIVSGTDNETILLRDGNGSLLWSHHFTVDVECVAISGDGSQ